MSTKNMVKRLCLLLTLLAVMALAIPAVAEDADNALTQPTVILEGNPTTGYTWNVTVADESIIAVTDDGFAANEAEEGVVGAAGYQHFSFEGKAEGYTTVTFAYGRSWETEEAPAYTLTYDLSVDSNLVVTIVATTFSLGGN